MTEKFNERMINGSLASNSLEMINTDSISAATTKCVSQPIDQSNNKSPNHLIDPSTHK